MVKPRTLGGTDEWQLGHVLTCTGTSEYLRQQSGCIFRLGVSIKCLGIGVHARCAQEERAEKGRELFCLNMAVRMAVTCGERISFVVDRSKVHFRDHKCLPIKPRRSKNRCIDLEHTVWLGCSLCKIESHWRARCIEMFSLCFFDFFCTACIHSLLHPVGQ